MNLFLKLFVVLSLCVVSKSLLADPPLIEAIKAWEDGRDDDAARLFHPLRKIPVARPYCMDLIKKGKLKNDYLFQEEDFKCLQQASFSQSGPTTSSIRESKDLYDISCLERMQKECLKESSNDERTKRKKIASISEKLMVLKSCSALFEQRKYKEAFEAGLDKGVLDLGFLSYLKGSGVNLKVGGEHFDSSKISILEASMEQEAIGDAFFKFSKLYRQDGAICQAFLRSAAFYGSNEAQVAFSAFHHSNNPGEYLFWTMQSAELEDPISLSEISYEFFLRRNSKKLLPKDMARGFILSKLAVERNEKHSPVIYFNHALNFMEGLGTEVNRSEASRFYRLAIDNGASPEVFRGYGILLGEQGEIEEAKKMLITSIKGGNPAAVKNYRILCKHPKEYEDVIPLCFEVAERDDEALMELSGMILRSATDVIESNKIRIYKLLNNRDKSKFLDIFNLRRGILLLEYNSDNVLQGNCVKCFQKCSNLGMGEGNFYLAKYYKDKGNSSEALKHYEVAIKNGMPAYLQAGNLLFKLGEYGKALTFWIKAYRGENEHYDTSKAAENRESAAFNLAFMYANGYGIEQPDFETAERYCSEALESEYVGIQACCLMVKIITQKEDDNRFAVGRKLLEKGVALHDPTSLLTMGQCILFDPECSKDLKNRKVAIQYIKEAIKQKTKYAKSIYLFFATTGIVKTSFHDIKLAFHMLDPEEKENYLDLIGKYTPGLKRILSEVSEEESLATEKASEESSDEASDEAQFVDPNFMVEMEGDQSNMEDNEATVAANKKFLKIQEELEGLFGQRKVKWSKVKNFIGRVMKVTSGVFKPGKGSGFKIHIGEEKTGLHIPHGKDSTEISGGSLESVRTFLEDNVDANIKANAAKDNAMNDSNIPKKSNNAKKNNKKKKNKNKK